MAQYKVPQDVEADDKLLGPFSFRQFVYLLVAGGLVALAIALFQLFPILAIIPILPALFFVVLALPLKKDQPMETYLAAIVSYYLKPRTRTWTPGQSESTIRITAPKKVEESRTRDITGEEATHRLSFLADIVDTEGQAIKGVTHSQVNSDLVTEAKTTSDMFETSHFDNLENTIAKDENLRHEEVMKEMREAIAKHENVTHDIQKRTDGVTQSVAQGQIAKPASAVQPIAQPVATVQSATSAPLASSILNTVGPDFDSSVVVKPSAPVEQERPVEKTNIANPKVAEKTEKPAPKPSIIELANNNDFSIATIAKEANRINRKDEGEVFISLH